MQFLSETVFLSSSDRLSSMLELSSFSIPKLKRLLGLFNEPSISFKADDLILLLAPKLSKSAFSLSLVSAIFLLNALRKSPLGREKYDPLEEGLNFLLLVLLLFWAIFANGFCVIIDVRAFEVSDASVVEASVVEMTWRFLACC